MKLNSCELRFKVNKILYNLVDVQREYIQDVLFSKDFKFILDNIDDFINCFYKIIIDSVLEEINSILLKENENVIEVEDDIKYFVKSFLYENRSCMKFRKKEISNNKFSIYYLHFLVKKYNSMSGNMQEAIINDIKLGRNLEEIFKDDIYNN